MNYYISEGKQGISFKYNAGAKARNDVEKILEELKLIKFYIPTVECTIKKSKILIPFEIFKYIYNQFIWKKYLKKMQKGDKVVIQYPLNNATFRFSNIIKKYSKKGVNFIAIIHDINSLRVNPPRAVYEDKTVLKEFSKIISHNKYMTEKLIELGCNKDKIIELEIFDYLLEDDLKEKERLKTNPIIIAGNLKQEKAGYIKLLKDISNIQFNLYGKGYMKKNDEKNICYKGAFLPEKLVNNLDGSFGLIWDGDAKETCSGSYGEYLKYNNPHKASLYLVAGIPVITWKESAIAKFILENKVGITIESLEQIDEKLKNLTDEEYYNMLNNAKRISKELRNGKNLKTAIKKI